MMNCDTSPFNSGGNIFYEKFYFDAVDNKKLNFIEYLDKLNIDFDKMTNIINSVMKIDNAFDEENNTEFGGLLSENQIRTAIVSDNGITVAYEGLWNMIKEHVDCNLEDIRKESRDSEQLVNADPAQLLTDFYYNNKTDLSVYTTTYDKKYPNMINAYLADLDNDAAPELCIKYIDSYDKCTHISIYKVVNGQVVL